MALASCLEVSQVRTVEKGDWGSMGGGLGSQSKEETPSANAVTLPSPTPRKFQVGEWEQERAAAPLAGPGETCQGKVAGKEGHLPLLIFMSQEKILHLLPAKIQFVVIIAFDSLGLIHRVIQRKEELFEGLHHWWRHT